MDFSEKFELQDCPICGGAGLLEDEEGNNYVVSCLDCGSHTVSIGYKEEAQAEDAARRAAELWNTGKVIYTGRTE